MRLTDLSKYLILLCFVVCSSQEMTAFGNPLGSATPKAPVHVFYIDPVKGSMNGDGSIARPWSTLEAVVAANLINGQDKASGAVHAGDLIYLYNGNHGSVDLSTYSGKFVNTDFITIQAAPSNTPVLNKLTLESCSHWAIRGLTFLNPTTIPQNYILVRFNQCDNILFDSNTIYSQSDVSKWTPTNWQTSSAYYGLYFTGVSSTLTNNTIKNIQNGVYIGGDGVILKSNTIDYFSNDGIEFSAGNSVIQSNRVTNHYGHYDTGLHADLIQGWTVGGLVTSNVVIDSNIVIASTGTYPQIPPVPTCVGVDMIQGISIFDGVWNNVTVTNNVVAAAAYHGMGFYGVSNSVIANNTVIRQGADQNYVAWIGVFESAGQTVTNTVVRNNIANNFQISVAGTVNDHNISLSNNNVWNNVSSNTIVLDPTKVFVTYQPSTATFNLNLSKTSPAVGTGTSRSAPKLNILGGTRNTLKENIGAY